MVCITRRGLVMAAAASVAPEPSAAPSGRARFRYSLNTSTIRGQRIPIEREVSIARKAGYSAIEPWISELEEYAKKGGSLPALKRQIADSGLTVESAIGFFEWVVDDAARRERAIETAKRNMELVAAIGGRRLAAPPLGATAAPIADRSAIGARYRTLLEIGDQMGVVPQCEFWGFSQTLATVADAAHCALAADHPKACILADLFHMFKSGSGFEGLSLLSNSMMHVIHLNDYPAGLTAASASDAQRIYPGTGAAPLDLVYRSLKEIGFNGVLSIELFNPGYYKLDALTVARTALEHAKKAERRTDGQL